MPRYQLLGKLLGLPGIKQLASVAYDYFFSCDLPLTRAPFAQGIHWHRRLRREQCRCCGKGDCFAVEAV
jgi:hypothetical protein